MLLSHINYMAQNSPSYFHCTTFIKDSRNSPQPCSTHKTGHYTLNKIKVKEKISNLASIYNLGICAYAVLKDQYQLVVRLDHYATNYLSDYDVVNRWSIEHKLPPLINDWLQENFPNSVQEQKVKQVISVWRNRLCSFSWFMKELNAYILQHAIQDYRQQNISLCFSSSSRRLCSPHSLLVRLGYVDLIYLLSKFCQYPEQSVYTSISERIQVHKNQNLVSSCLVPFLLDIEINTDTEMNTEEYSIRTLPFLQSDYLYLINWTYVRNTSERLFILDEIPNILTQLKISPVSWLTSCSSFKKAMETDVGSSDSTLHAINALKIKPFPS